jgi:hypothetical protein
VHALLAPVAAAAVLVAAACAPGGGVPGPSEDWHTERAPIDGLEVVIRESEPPQITARITAGLPNGCAKQHSYEVLRSGNTVAVAVLNSMPPAATACDMIYGTYELMVDLGKGYQRGVTYTVSVNDRSTTFTL